MRKAMLSGLLGSLAILLALALPLRAAEDRTIDRGLEILNRLARR